MKKLDPYTQQRNIGESIASKKSRGFEALVDLPPKEKIRLV